MNNQKILGYLGLAARSRNIVTGEEQVLITIRNQSAKIVFLASDAGVNTTKRITDKCTFYHINLVTSLSGADLSKSIGKGNRKVIAITDRHFAEMITIAIEEL